jgi:hypothetical protein
LSDVVLTLREFVADQQVTVAIANVDSDGSPIIPSPLASSSFTLSPTSTYNDVDVSFATPAKVKAGTQYGIVLSAATQNPPNGPYVVWRGDLGSSTRDPNGTACADGAYAGGRVWSNDINPPGAGADLFFATYVVPSRHVTVSKNGSGNGSVQDSGGAIKCGPTCEADVTKGQSLTLTATPDSKSNFTTWSGGTCSGTAPTCTFEVAADATVTATFTAKPASLTVRKAGAGTVSSRPGGIGCGKKCRSSFPPGQITLNERPAAGWRFVRWQGSCRGTKPACRVTLSAASNVTVTAIFSMK